MDGAAIALRRDVRVISLIGFGHFFSHFYQLALAPLFIMIHNEMGFSFTELGILIGVFYAASAFFQPPAGFLIDRFGARLALLGGLAVMAISFIGYGIRPITAFYPQPSKSLGSDGPSAPIICLGSSATRRRRC